MKKKEMFGTVTWLISNNEKLLNNKKFSENIIEDLTDYQEKTIKLGKAIEEQYMTFDEKTVKEVISVLEKYCECIYQISIQLTNMDECKKIIKKIQKKMIPLQYKIENYFPNDKKEVAFLPYKASMWDSLESIWKKANADENVNAYVIPIPYFEKNADGSLGKMHYEGNQYPHYVPITMYNEYDFEKNKLDEIYIHNPYDEYNFVTSVPPFFYSSNLKKYTEKLIYTPYFVSDEINFRDIDNIESIKHFCTVPGVLNADKVILQSEEMKRIYIKVLTEATNNKSEKALEYWDNKIEGTGSPKIDKALNMGKEEYEIPEEWKHLVWRTDGRKKKTIFYNTGIGAFLTYGSEMIQQIEKVFKCAYDNRDRVILLWRPHPLLENTIKSMRPQLMESYSALRDWFVEETIGIYDNTADLYRAIFLSDLYYGDPSSVIPLFKKVKKEVVMQNISTEREFMYGYSNHAFNTFENIFFAGVNAGVIYVFDKERQSIMKAYCNDCGRTKFSIFQVLEWKNKIISIPRRGNHVAIIDKTTRTVKKICIDFEQSGVLFGGALIDDILYIVPLINHPTMYRINMNDSKIYTESSGHYHEILPNPSEKIRFFKPQGCEKSIWVILGDNSGKILEYQIRKKEWSVHQLSFNIINYTYTGRYFYLLSNDFKIYRWRKNENIQLFYELNMQKLGEASYFQIESNEENLVIVPYDSNLAAIISIKNHHTEYLEIKGHRTNAILDEENVYFYSYFNSEILKYNIKNQFFTSVNIALNDKIRDYILRESDEISLIIKSEI